MKPLEIITVDSTDKKTINITTKDYGPAFDKVINEEIKKLIK